MLKLAVLSLLLKADHIEVCLALIGPSLLLLDEPTADLSPAETVAFTKALKLIDRDITILLIEHDMSGALR